MDLDLEPINLKPIEPIEIDLKGFEDIEFKPLTPIDLKGFENVELKPLEYIPFNMFEDVELKPIDDIDLDLSNFNLTWQ